jgi:hypothetical protein
MDNNSKEEKQKKKFKPVEEEYKICTERIDVNNWQYVPFLELAEIISGGTPKTTNSSYWGGSIPWLSIADFNGAYRWVE